MRARVRSAKTKVVAWADGSSWRGAAQAAFLQGATLRQAPSRRAESRPSLRWRIQSCSLTKAAIQTLSELNPLAAMDAKVSDGQGVEFTMLRLVPDTRPSAIYDQARPPLDDPGATGNRKSEQNDIAGRHIGSPVGQRQIEHSDPPCQCKNPTRPNPIRPRRPVVRCVSQGHAHLKTGGGEGYNCFTAPQLKALSKLILLFLISAPKKSIIFCKRSAHARRELFHCIRSVCGCAIRVQSQNVLAAELTCFVRNEIQASVESV